MISLLADSPLPTDLGTFHMFVFENSETKSQEIALTYGDCHRNDNVLVRMHSACVTSEIFGANNCECRQQLDEAMRRIVEQGTGVILYLAQEGRGHGLAAKVKTLNMVVQGVDPQTAFAELGLPSDLRSYTVAAEILKALGINGPIEILTNNLKKSKSLQEAGITIARQTDLYIEPKNHTVKRYLEAKRDKEGHSLPYTIEICEVSHPQNAASKSEPTIMLKEEISRVASPDMIVIGDINLDWYVEDQLSFVFTDLKENGRTEHRSIDERVGGTGLNFARFAKEIGYNPILVGNVGADIAGQFLLEWLEKNGINAAVGVKRSFPTGRAFIAFDQNNIRFLVDNSPNANSSLSSDDIERYQELITDTPLLYVSGYCLSRPPSESPQTRATLQAMRLAKSKGNSHVVLDVVPHQIYKTYSYEEFRELTVDVDILVAEVATIRRFLGKGDLQEDIGQIQAQQTAELLAHTFDRFILRYGPSGINMQTIWDKNIGQLLFKPTDYHKVKDKRGYGDKLTLQTLQEVFNLRPRFSRR